MPFCVMLLNAKHVFCLEHNVKKVYNKEKSLTVRLDAYFSQSLSVDLKRDDKDYLVFRLCNDYKQTSLVPFIGIRVTHLSFFSSSQVQNTKKSPSRRQSNSGNAK